MWKANGLIAVENGSWAEEIKGGKTIKDTRKRKDNLENKEGKSIIPP
jgi:hypothetical protein